MIGSACALATVANRKVPIARSRSSFWVDICRDLRMTIVKNPFSGMWRRRKDWKCAPQAMLRARLGCGQCYSLTARLKTIIVL
jgi:hypothetical protein